MKDCSKKTLEDVAYDTINQSASANEEIRLYQERLYQELIKAEDAKAERQAKQKSNLWSVTEWALFATSLGWLLTAIALLFTLRK